MTKRALVLVILLFCSVVGVSRDARADWYPSYSGSSNYGSDMYGAAVDAVNHSYPTHGDIAFSGPIYYDSYGRPSLFQVCAKRNPGSTSPPYWCAYSSNTCPYPQFRTLYGCANNSVAYQGTSCNCVAGKKTPTGANAMVGDPINIISGNVFETATDFDTRGQDRLGSTRYYSSDTTYVYGPKSLFSTELSFLTSRFGYAWRSEYDRFIVPNSTTPSSATWIDSITADGNPVSFEKSGSTWYIPYTTSGGGSSLSGDPRHDVDMTISTDGTSWFLKDSNDVTYQFDAHGKLTTITYRNGYQQTLGYDANGNNTSVTDSFGRQITFTYLANGLADTMTDPDGNVTHFGYVERSGMSPPASSGNTGLWILQSVTYPDTKTVTYLYEDTRPINRFALTGITDENGNRYATWAYDSTGRGISNSMGSGVQSYSIAYDDVANTRTVTNPLGKQTIFNLGTFQAHFRISSIAGQTSAHTAAGTTSFAYDANGFESQETSQEGRVTTYVHDSKGEETSRTEGYGTAVARTISTTWDTTYHVPTQIVQPNLTTNLTYTSGLLTQLTQTDTTTTSVPYSTNGQTRTWAYTYYSNGLLHTVDGPLSGSGDTVTYAYDTHGFVNSITNEVGQVTSITSSNGRGEPLTSVDPNGVTTNYTYDLRGRLTSITVNPGAARAVTSLTYDSAGNITQIVAADGSTLNYAYDSAHRLTAVTNASGESINYTLDASGDRTATVVRNSSSTITRQQTATFDELARVLTDIGASSQTTSHAWDRDNNEVSTTDPRSKLYAHAFDAIDRLNQETDPDSFATIIALNGKDDVTSVTDGRSNATIYVRDGFGDAIRVSSPDTGNTDFWFDAAGRKTKSVDARSIETDYTYDAAGRVLTKTFPASSSENVTYTYDSTSGGNVGVGRLTSIADASGSTSFTYNALGQVTDDHRVIQSNTYDIGYTYDAGGNVLTATYPSGRIVTYTRDSLGRISGITTRNNALSSPVTVTSSVTYMPFGPVASLTFGDGTLLSLTYDQDYRLTGIGAANGSTTIQNLVYGYDAASNITTITDNLTSARSQTFTYDDLDRLASASGLYGSISYTYDGVGNRLTDVSGGTTDAFAYPSSSNRLSSVTTGTNVRSLTTLSSGQISDDTRNSSTDYSYSYDSSGRLITATLNSSTVGTYLCNALGQRVVKTVGSTVTQFVFDSVGHLIEEADSTGAAVREYIWLDDIPVALVDHSGASPVVYYIHSDHLNRPQKITDSTGTIVWDGVFDPFGNLTSVSGSVTNLLMFPGQYYDSETQLSQNWHRDYDPTLGRYIESDPLGLDAAINTYVYVDGNPAKSADSTGLIDNCVLKAICPGVTPPMTPAQEAAFEKEVHALEIELSIITIALPIAEECAIGDELVFGRNVRIAPFGNRTRNPLGRWPHYHRRGIDPLTGETRAGQGIGRHRPWETKSTDTSFWDRF